MTRLAALVLAIAACSCTASQRVTASRQDYALYRDVRVAESTAERLARSRRYLREEPNGRFRAEVQSWFDAAEPRFYAVARDRPSLLRTYLRAMPDGPHAKAAEDRLAELELLREYRARQERREAELSRQMEARLADAASRRRAFVREIRELVREVAKVRSFGATISALEDTMKYRLAAGPEDARCDFTRCAKRLTLRYAIPENREIVERNVPLELAFELERGLLVRASFGGPLLFSRVAEAVDLTPVATTDLRARVEAIGQSAQVLGNALEELLPTAECAREVVAPRILVRECRGVRVELRAGVSLEDPDRIEVTRARAAP